MRLSGLFHASKNLFHELQYDEFVKNHNPEYHDNGNLGMWFSLRADWLSPFGSNVYGFDLMDDVKIKSLTVSELASLGHQVDEFDFIGHRNELIKLGFDVIAVVECSGVVEMGIVLNFDKVQNFRLLKL